MPATFPPIALDGDLVDAKNCIEKGTTSALVGAVIVAFFGTLLGILLSYGILLLVLLVSPFISSYVNKKAMALIHGSGLKIGESQIPEIHDCVNTFAKRLGLTAHVEVYVVQQSVMNAAAVRYGKRNVILLTDDLIHGCLRSGAPQALSFVLAHELAHIALKHNSIFRSWARQHLRKLGRLDEYSCDRIAVKLVGDRNIAVSGLLLLTVGQAVMPYVNAGSLVTQTQEVAADKYSTKAEKQLTHPLLLNRIHRVLHQ